MEKGLFITFEGIDGVGKTTQAQRLVCKLEELGSDVTFTREPGGTSIGQRIRRLLLDPDLKQLSQQTEVFLYAADRAQHVQELIKPQLESGKTVICDRYVDSSIAYQGFGLGWDPQMIRAINSWAIMEIVPDITLCLDQDPELALAKTSGDRIEIRTLDYYRRVRTGYYQIAKDEPSRFHIIPAAGSVEEVFTRIWHIIKGRVI